jgi:hypothetical protein
MHGLIRAATLGLALGLASPVFSGEVADLLAQGPIGACLEDHFDPERYADDLEAGGWFPLPDEIVPQAAQFLAVAFLPMTHPPIPGRPDVPSVRLQTAQAAWESELQTRPALVQGDSIVQLRGFTEADSGMQVLECWLLTPDIAFVEGLLARAETEAPIPPDAAVVALLEPEDLSDRVQLQVLVSRNPNPPGPEVGLITRLQISPAP